MNYQPGHLIEVVVRPASKQDRKKLAGALQEIKRHDPDLLVERVGLSSDFVLGAMSEDQLVNALVRVEQLATFEHSVPNIVYHTIAINGMPIVLEPIMIIEIKTPADCAKGVSQDINNRSGAINDKKKIADNFEIQAFVPLSTLFGYTITLRALTQGRGIYTIKLSHYEPVFFPENDPPKRPAVSMSAG